MLYIPVDLGLPSGLLWAAENTPAANGGALLPFKEVIVPDKDADAFRWERRWVVPGREAYEELRQHCTLSWEGERGGAIVTGPNGNTLFLPAAGWSDEGGLQVYADKGCYYWTGDAAVKDNGKSEESKVWAYNIFDYERTNGQHVGVKVIPMPVDVDRHFCLRKVRPAPSIDDIIDTGDALADIIADERGMNVSYCDSMDMDLVGFLGRCLEDESEIDVLYDSLQFYAENERALPKYLSAASAEELKDYFRKNRNAILAEAEDILDEHGGSERVLDD